MAPVVLANAKVNTLAGAVRRLQGLPQDTEDTIPIPLSWIRRNGASHEHE